ncbi:DMT family transporter [Aureimonas frigidaquae]|nr:DMT family transporter [Aureimonas frigidaquae]
MAGRIAASTMSGDGFAPAYAAFAALGLIWGSNFIFTKWAAVLISPEQIVLMRVLFGFVPLAIAGLAGGALHWKHIRYVHHFAVMSVLATAFYYIAFAKGTVLLLSSVAGMLSGAIPIFTFVTAMVFLRSEPINARSIGGTLLGFMGILLIARPWDPALGSVDPAGIGWMIAGSFSVGASFVYARRFISPLGLPPLALTTYQTGIALLALLVTTDLAGVGAVFADRRAWLGLVFGLGLCGTGLAYILYYRIVDRLGAVAASGVTYIPPVESLAIGALFVGEPVRWRDAAAMGLILFGVAVLQSARHARSQIDGCQT